MDKSFLRIILIPLAFKIKRMAFVVTIIATLVKANIKIPNFSIISIITIILLHSLFYLLSNTFAIMVNKILPYHMVYFI